MAVAFMISLEDSPETYDHSFDRVLEGRATRIREDILQYVEPGMRVLDLGCGPGLFARMAAEKGAVVDAIDADANMIEFAKSQSVGLQTPPNFVNLDVLRLGESDTSQLLGDSLSGAEYDLIVSTFLLSEMKPSERHLLMKIVRDRLKKKGTFIIAAETLPHAWGARRKFWRNRRRAIKESGKRLSQPIKDLARIARESGLEVEMSKQYGQEITLIAGKRARGEFKSLYGSRTLPFHGPKARARIWYNHLTGSWRGMPIDPGLYKVGAPNPESPVVVTANYELTYYTVMRALARAGIDAWVLVCDTDGINVWCAARGVHFDTDDIVNMVNLTELENVVNHRELILPQLAAAGMDPSEIKRRTGFRVRYGPVKIHDLAEWLRLGKPRPKPRGMSTVTFNLRERMEMSVAHIPFLFAVLLWKPIAALLFGLALVDPFVFLLFPDAFLLSAAPSIAVLSVLAQFILVLFANAFVLGLIFPVLPSKGNSFLRRGVGFAGMTVPAVLLILLFLGAHWTLVVNWTAVQFILAITLTMDFAGMTPVSDPKSIRAEYPYMLLTLILGAIFLVAFNLLAFTLGW